MRVFSVFRVFSVLVLCCLTLVAARAANTIQSGTNYLSDLSWISAVSGFGPVERNMSNGVGGAGDGTALMINGQVFAKGLGVHSNSDIKFNVAGQCTRFKAVIGINDFRLTEPIGARGSVDFAVYADGVQKFGSPILRGDSAAITIDIDITGAKELRLVTGATPDGIAYDHANWANATVTCSVTSAARINYEQVMIKENFRDGGGNPVELSTWVLDGHDYVNTPVRSGRYSMRVLNNTDASWIWASGFITTFSFWPFESFSFWIYSPIADPTVTVNVVWQDNSTTGDINNVRTEGPRVALPRGIAARTWTRVIVPIAKLIPDLSNRHSIVRLDFRGNISGGVYLDDLSLLGSQPNRAKVQVDAASVIRAVEPRLSGTGLAYWNGNNNTQRAINYVAGLGVGALRYVNDSNVRRFQPGGFGNSHKVVDANPQAVLYTILHGYNFTLGVPASVAEAKALVAYLRVPAANDPRGSAAPLWDKRAIVIDAFDAAYEDWSSGTPTIVRYREPSHTAGWWADLRAALPLAMDDGLNDLRVGHVAPFNVRYFELDNEPFWNSPTSPTPADYVGWLKGLLVPTGIKQIDPNLKWGVPATGSGNNGTWDLDMLTLMAAAPRIVPDFIVHHFYAPGWDDYEALFSGVSARFGDPKLGAIGTWPMEAHRYRALIDQAYRGSVAPRSIELAMTEINISEGSKVNQTLTAGLYFADQIGALLGSDFSTALSFHFRDGTVKPASTYSGANLYGWQTITAFGMIQDPLPEPRTPHYWGIAMASKLIQGGGSVIKVTNDNLLVSAYATRSASGRLNVLLINKAKNDDMPVELSISGYDPRATATVYRYGKAQDSAAQSGPTSIATTTLSNASRQFSVTLPAYSITVIQMSQ